MMDLQKARNYYEILEVSPNSSQDEIYQGYLRAKGAYSGDNIALYSLMTDDECRKMVELIEEAYSIIGDPLKRNEYNNARGIVGGNSLPNKNAISNMANKLHQSQTKESESSKMSKIVAKKKFALDFTVDPEMEREIEQTSEFTGEFLKKIREYKNIDIKRLSEMTKISKTYLRNIEDDDFDALPAVVYARGFVYQYAKCLKLNPDLVANSYVDRLKQYRS